MSGDRSYEPADILQINDIFILIFKDGTEIIESDEKNLLLKQPKQEKENYDD
jgi:hypothetical protein